MGEVRGTYRKDIECPDAEERRLVQIKEMKRKLRDLYKNSDYKSIKNLYEDLILFDQSLYFSENSLSQTLNTEQGSKYETTFNLYAAITMCRFFRKDISSLFVSPEAGKNTLEDADPLQAVGKYIVLDDPQYFGDFYGYMYSKYMKRKNVIPFKLSINKSGDRVEALFEYRDPRKPLVLSGVPKLITRSKNIYIIFSNPDGEFFEFFFHYKPYRVDKMWYRRGIVIADESSTDSPEVANFVLFDREISDEKFRYIPGLLMISGPRFCISEKKILEMRQDSNVAKFLDDFSYLFEHDKSPMYVFDEDTIMSIIKNEEPERKHFLISQLLLIREQAEISHNITYTMDSEYPEYARKYLTVDDES